MPKRLELIQNTVRINEGIQVIISYERLLSEDFLDYFTTRNRASKISDFNYKKERYSLYEILVENGRKVKFLSTPFFGNGCISYDGIRQVVSRFFT